MIRSLAVAVMLSLGTVGCGAPNYRSDRGASQDQFMQDRYSCAQEARGVSSSGYADRYGAATRGGTSVNRSLFMSCMAARGYYQDSNGPLVVPQGAVIYMRD